MDTPLISCIIPVFNGKQYLKEAIDSVLAQTYHPIEIIIVDDGSIDGTAIIVQDFKEQVRYIYQANAGAQVARNHGLQIARGEFVTFLDADDLWHQEKLARQISRFQGRPELDLSVSHIQNFWAPELQEEAERFHNHRLSQPIPGYTTQTLLARRVVFLETVGQLDTALPHANETDWFIRARELGLVLELLPDVLVYRRLHENNLSRQKAKASREEYLQLIKAMLDHRRVRLKGP